MEYPTCLPPLYIEMLEHFFNVLKLRQIKQPLTSILNVYTKCMVGLTHTSFMSKFSCNFDFKV